MSRYTDTLPVMNGTGSWWIMKSLAVRKGINELMMEIHIKCSGVISIARAYGSPMFLDWLPVEADLLDIGLNLDQPLCLSLSLSLTVSLSISLSLSSTDFPETQGPCAGQGVGLRRDSSFSLRTASPLGCGTSDPPGST